MDQVRYFERAPCTRTTRTRTDDLKGFLLGLNLGQYKEQGRSTAKRPAAKEGGDRTQPWSPPLISTPTLPQTATSTSAVSAQCLLLVLGSPYRGTGDLSLSVVDSHWVRLFSAFRRQNCRSNGLN
ncbi:hypothetical protein FRC15_002498 [Serendipita sp. 397]|nr:hypothetical protein FRC15_002498 [Serendipita sp. 397]